MHVSSRDFFPPRSIRLRVSSLAALVLALAVACPPRAEGRFTFRWRDNADNECGFRVERSLDGAAFATVATVPANATRYDDDTVAGGQRYWYRVAAFNAGGDSEYTATVSGIAPAVPASAPNTAPAISSLADRTVLLGTAPGSWTFTIADAETAPDDLTLIGNTSNPALVPMANLRFSGTGAERTLSVTPQANAVGWTTVWVKVSDGDRDAVTSFVLVVTAPGAEAERGWLTNLSTRGRAASADPLTVGFVVAGGSGKRVLLRAIGPGLAKPPFLVPAVLPDPRVTMLSWDGTAYSPYATNRDWGTDAGAVICAAARALFAFDLDEASSDAALLVDVPRGQYTAVVEDEQGAAGIGLAELYDADGESATRFINLSTRGHVGVGGEELIGGFVIGGTGSMRVLVRAVGPGLAGEPFHVPGSLQDPGLELYQQEIGGDAVSVFRQDDWGSGDDPAGTASVAARVGAFPLAAGSRDAAAVLTLGPGVYTAVVRGVGGTTGTALVEIYDAN